MAQNESAPPRDYFADSESSDLYEMDHHHPSPPSPPPPPHPRRMVRTTFKPTRSRHVTVRSPSEEDLFERTFDTGIRRTPTPYALVRHSSSDEEEDYYETSKAHNKQHKQPKQQKPVTENATTPPGRSPYNAPAGTTIQNDANQVHLQSQPFSNNNNQPYPYAINYAGQPAPILFVNPATMEDYQNSIPNNNGLHFQPQVPDTSLGPMIHNYRPNFDGGVYYAQPGIAVCQPSPSYVVSSSPFIHYLTPHNQPIRPITFAQAPLVAMPAVAPAVVVCPPIIASAPVYTTLGYKGDDRTVASREFVVVRRVSTLEQCFFLFTNALPAGQTC